MTTSGETLRASVRRPPGDPPTRPAVAPPSGPRDGTGARDGATRQSPRDGAPGGPGETDRPIPQASQVRDGGITRLRATT